MNDSEALEEWAYLRGALRAHVDWLVDTGVEALRPCDDATLEERRARYRELAREVPAATTLPTAAPMEESRPALPLAPSSASAPAPLVPAQPTSGDAPAAAPPDLAEAAFSAIAALTQRPRTPRSAQVGSIAQEAARVAAGRATQGLELARTVPDLDALAKEVAACQRCELHRTRTQTVFARGSGSSGICFIGEGPGADEDEQGFPFVGAAGQLLDKMIAAMGLGRDEVYVCNIVKCRPPQNRKPEREEMQACSGFLQRQIELLAPRAIVALGGTAIEGLLGLSGIVRLRGQWRLYRGEIPVMPTFHPAYLLRTPEAKREVWNDLKLVLEHLGRPVPAR